MLIRGHLKVSATRGSAAADAERHFGKGVITQK
jgi:hypothetical protein